MRTEFEGRYRTRLLGCWVGVGQGWGGGWECLTAKRGGRCGGWIAFRHECELLGMRTPEARRPGPLAGEACNSRLQNRLAGAAGPTA